MRGHWKKFKQQSDDVFPVLVPMYKAVGSYGGNMQNLILTNTGYCYSALAGAGWTQAGQPRVGAEFYQRIGSRIRMQQLQIVGYFQPTGNNVLPVQEQMARIMFVYDRQTNGILPAVSDILQSYDCDATTNPQAFAAQLNLDNIGRFHVLWERFIVLPPLAANGAAPADPYTMELESRTMQVVTTLDLCGLQMHFKDDPARGDISGVASGSLLVLGVAEVSGNDWQFTFFVRLTYLD